MSSRPFRLIDGPVHDPVTLGRRVRAVQHALAVPDPLASDTGQGIDPANVRLAMDHGAYGENVCALAAIEALADEIDRLRAPLASSSAPQGEKRTIRVISYGPTLIERAQRWQREHAEANTPTPDETYLLIRDFLIAASPSDDGARQPQGLDLEPIKAREAAATRGPWLSDEYRVFAGRDDYDACIIDTKHQPFYNERSRQEADQCADMAFIAHARHDVPALIDEIERLRAAASDDGAAHQSRLCALMDALAVLEGRCGADDRSAAYAVAGAARAYVDSLTTADDGAARPQPAQDPKEPNS